MAGSWSGDVRFGQIWVDEGGFGWVRVSFVEFWEGFVGFCWGLGGFGLIGGVVGTFILLGFEEGWEVVDDLHGLDADGGDAVSQKLGPRPESPDRPLFRV